MASRTLFTLFLSLLSLSSGIRYATSKEPDISPGILRSSCIHARYPNLCIRTLSSVAGSAKTPNDLAQAAVSVSLSHARNVSAFVSRHLKTPTATKRERGALRDCVELLSDTVDQLRRTLSELRHLRPGTFRWQMSNAETWVSAALTNEDTCLDGFQTIKGRLKKAVKRKVTNVCHVTSNALYLINRLASTRGHAIAEP